MHDDAELVKRTVDGDRDAAGAIYDRYAPLVRAVLFDSTGSLPEAEDLTQNVFLKALSRLDQLRQADSLGAWIVQIAKREGTEFRRGAAIRRERFTTLVEDPSSEKTDVSTGTETVDLVRQAVRELPEQERMAIHIFYLSDEPAEVARQVLGLSRSGLYKVLDRARRRLHQSLVERENIR